MIEFHAGTGLDSQTVGIALEEMFLDYRVMSGKAPLPVIAIAGARIAGAGNIVMALARKTGRFLGQGDPLAWLAPSPPDHAALAAALVSRDFVLGEFSVADMALYPRFEGKGVLEKDEAIARWARRMMQRPATGRGMGVTAL